MCDTSLHAACFASCIHLLFTSTYLTTAAPQMRGESELLTTKSSSPSSHSCEACAPPRCVASLRVPPLNQCQASLPPLCRILRSLPCPARPPTLLRSLYSMSLPEVLPLSGDDEASILGLTRPACACMRVCVHVKQERVCVMHT
jgi:hypothetical protein